MGCLPLLWLLDILLFVGRIGRIGRVGSALDIDTEVEEGLDWKGYGWMFWTFARGIKVSCGYLKLSA